MEESSILNEFGDICIEDVSDPKEGLFHVDYRPDFLKYMGTLCACVKNGEISDRVYRLTEEVIYLNPSFITAWIVREKCIEELGVDWDKEFIFLDKVREINEKCYQTWMHRHFVVQKSGIYTREKDYCDSYIQLDNKNIHSWTHRLWVVETYDLWEGEMEYTEKCIKEDIFNNSAWSHRFTVFTHLHKATDSIDDELSYVINMLNTAPHNEACWNYVSGLMKYYQGACFDDVAYEARRFITKDPNVFAYSFLIEYDKASFEVDKINEALSFCQKLQEYDETRKLYWEKVAEDIQQYYGFLFETCSFV